jgi:hypothetical protein
MEDIVYSPSHRESQLICYRGDFFDDPEGSVSFRLELCFLMADLKVSCL